MQKKIDMKIPEHFSHANQSGPTKKTPPLVGTEDIPSIRPPTITDGRLSYEKEKRWHQLFHIQRHHFSAHGIKE